jgi:hypothetical protein
MKRECKTCEWYVQNPKFVCGECRKNAPYPVTEDEQPVYWPLVDNCDWCGEYQNKDEANETD